jgi:dihydropteroate synthase
MGIINATPDSFSDGGRFLEPDAAVRRAVEMVEQGAGVIDVGGESTRPGAEPLPADAEIARVVPIVQLLARELDVPVSVDTVKADVAAAALDGGAVIVNDVSGFRLDPGMAAVCAAAGAGVVLMHSRGSVADMATYARADYRDVVGETIAELERCVERALVAGIPDDAIVVDPGIGFSKRSEHSLRLLAELPSLAALGYPVLIGVSRKRFVGEATGVAAPDARAVGSAAACAVGLMNGASIFRVHDVRVAREALDMAFAIRNATGAES